MYYEHRMAARDPRAFLLADIAFKSSEQRGTVNIAIKQTCQNLEDAFDQLPEYARNAITAVEQQLKRPREAI